MIGFSSVTDVRAITRKGETSPMLTRKKSASKKMFAGIIMEMTGQIASAKSALWMSACNCFVLERIDARMTRNLRMTWRSLQNIEAYAAIVTAVVRATYG